MLSMVFNTNIICIYSYTAQYSSLINFSGVLSVFKIGRHDDIENVHLPILNFISGFNIHMTIVFSSFSGLLSCHPLTKYLSSPFLIA